MRWPEPSLATFDEATSRAQAGVPAVVGLEGRAGFGKSTFLREAASRLSGFQVLRAYGERDAQDDRFQLVSTWSDAPPPHNAMHAMRQLTAVLSQQQLTGPVALLIDDLQWIDPDSVEMLASLVERAVGDRLLVVGAYRPLEVRHPAWRRLQISTIRLEGLDTDSAADLVASFAADAPTGLVEQLLTHTGGSPLHIRALLQERSAAELLQLGKLGALPAPADLAAEVDARIGQFAPEAGRLLRTLAVLGDAWTEVANAALVAGISDTDEAIQLLLSEGLLRRDDISAVPRIRISHAVIRAAVYQTMPGPVCRSLHRAAAARLPHLGDQLRHRFAAAVGPDEGLAADLDQYAADRHARDLFGEAARLRRFAAAVSATTAAREARILESDVESMLAREPDQASVIDVDEAAGAQRRLVYALRLNGLKQWVQAANVLVDVDVDVLDPINTYRAHVLRAWTTLASGRRPADALAPLHAAERCAVKDHIFQGLFISTYGQVMQATTDQHEPLWGFDDSLDTDRATMAASLEGLHRLSWRGAVFAITGATTPAIDDLGAVINRMDDGAIGLTDGILHAFLGFSHWCKGEWRRATIDLDTARRINSFAAHPTVLAIQPLAAIVTGDDPSASLEASRNARLAGPISAAIYTGDVTEIAVVAYTGTPQQRHDWRERRTADFGMPIPRTAGRPPLVWLLAMGIAAAWAGDAFAVDEWADALAERSGSPWRAPAEHWLRALSAATRGDTSSLAAMNDMVLPDLGSFEALARIDVARNTSDPLVHRRAQESLTQLGAARYTSALLPQAPAALDPLAALSNREKEVTTLLLEGLSYQQIARELYVTRSTINFHLSRIYAKTATSNRHDLAELCAPARPTSR